MAAMESFGVKDASLWRNDQRSPTFKGREVNMMGILGMIAIVGMHGQVGRPVLWLAPSGQIEVAGKPIEARITPGAWRVSLGGGYAYNFNGKRGGILLGDLPALRLTGSITVSV